MIKKNIRQRKEYLFKKNEEIQRKLIHEKKLRLKSAIEQEKPIPGDLKKESDTLLKELDYDDDNTILPYSVVDDEYSSSKYLEPKILVTTSRSPSQRLTQFLKEMRLIFPNSVRVNRGNTVIKELVKTCQENEFSDLIILHENRGVPDGMIVSHMPFGPTVYFGLFNVLLRHDIEEEIDTVSEAYPHLIFDGFESRLGNRIAEIWKNLFPVPKLDSQRIITLKNNDDYISFRHHTFKKNKSNNSKDNIELDEVGPRFEMRPYQILLGTIDMPDANKEWVLRPYMNTSRKKKLI
jgi:U3 small nucleolar ribonucleoprotein protein IMP4